MSKYKSQHYLSQFYLKRFSRDEHKEKNREITVWCFFKKENRIQKKSITNIAQRPYYYSWLDEQDQFDHSVEKILSDFESSVAPIIRKIDNNVKELIKTTALKSDLTTFKKLKSQKNLYCLNFYY